VYWIKGAIAGTLILVAGHGVSLRRKNSGIKVTPRGPTINSPRIDLQMAFVISTMRPWRVDFVVVEAGEGLVESGGRKEWRGAPTSRGCRKCSKKYGTSRSDCGGERERMREGG
jgi:hypothetical protein